MSKNKTKVLGYGYRLKSETIEQVLSDYYAISVLRHCLLKTSARVDKTITVDRKEESIAQNAKVIKFRVVLEEIDE